MIEIVFDVLFIIFLFAVFGVIHSFLASHKVKKELAEQYGSLIAFYRLIYNIIAFASFYLIYEISPRPDVLVYDLPSPYDLLILIPQFLALAGVLWALKYFCIREFLGIDQIKRYFRKEYSPGDLDEKLSLVIDGPYRYTRHPIYFFSIIIIFLRPEMDLFDLTFFLCIAVYFYIGSYYEEKKLVENFGEIYKKYQNEVPRIFPVKLFHPFNQKENLV